MSITVAELYKLIDLTTVPVPDFVETLDYEAIRKSAIADLVARDPSYTAIVESDPAIKIIEVFCYRELLLRQRVNDAALANTVTKAVGADLEVIAAFFGVTRLAGELDESLRKRASMGVYAGAVAGPKQAYEFRALTSDVRVIDALAYSTEPGVVSLTVLAFVEVDDADATTLEKQVGRALFAQPSDTTKVRILAGASTPPLVAARAAVTGKDVRPLTDSVTVGPPVVKSFTVSAQLVIYPGPDATTVRASALASLASYLQSIRRVSYDATASGIVAALKVGGVQDVILNSPVASITAGYNELPVCIGVTVGIAGVDV